jgi:hypothetical protein
MAKIRIRKRDRKWLEKHYGKDWPTRLTQHIHHVVEDRKQRVGWDIDGTVRRSKSRAKRRTQ